jgi:uracil-DNA glycosylase
MGTPLCRLVRETAACTLCEADLPLGPRPVFQVHTAATILVAAQAPGTKVHASGRPFTDTSGDRLREWMGINSETFYDPSRVAILPMGFCYPGRGKSGDLPPRSECAPAWRQRFLDLLPRLELTLVIGQYAHAWHLERRRQRTLTETVQDWRAFAPDVIPLPHPSPRNNMWLRRNPWFADELLPVLARRVQSVLR